MSIIKNTPNILKHSGLPFTTVINKTLDLIKDPATLGIYVYLSGKPTDWTISETNLQHRFGKCRDFIRARLSEIKKLGLIQSKSIRNDKNQIIKWETTLFNEPQPLKEYGSEDTFEEESRLLEIQDTGKARILVEPPTTNKRLLEIKESKIKDLKNTPISQECDEGVVRKLKPREKGTNQRSKGTNPRAIGTNPRNVVIFEKFWELYPTKIAKKKCLDVWMKRNLDGISHLIIDKLKEQIAFDDKWLRGFSPNPLTYINQDRWEDDIANPIKSSSNKSNSFSKYINSQSNGQTYDQQGKTYDPFR